MKKFTNVVLAASFLLLVYCFSATAQTNVSGGIYANTTWTLANSPYIVVDTVVVFPGDTLTIEPGVTVRFKNNMLLENRGDLIALGTAVDSITFTSDSLVPSAGIWQGIVTYSGEASIDYCIFQYADNALYYGSNASYDSIQHSYFYMNNNCLEGNYYNQYIIQSSFYYNNSCITGSEDVYIIQSSFYYNNSCIGNPYSININQSSFYNNTNCFGSTNSGPTDCSLDSCTFTNNINGPELGDNCNITNCIFLGNSTAIGCYNGGGTEDHLVQNCIFCNNGLGFFSFNYSHLTTNDRLINCNFSNNGIAIQNLYYYVTGPILTGNILTDNDTAVVGYVVGTDNYIFHNKVGIVYKGGPSSPFSNNYICNNSIYNIIYTSSYNGSIPPVCYCDTDSATIRSKIYDGYDNISLGLLSFTPFVSCDSSVILALQPINCPAVVTTDVEEYTNHLGTGMFEIYPNPASKYLTVELAANNSKTEIKIFNMLGELAYTSTLTWQKTTIDISTLNRGMYIIQVATADKISRQKLIRE